MLGSFLLLIFPMFPFSKKLILFCDGRVVPICFCASPGRPFREILLGVRFFHSRDITSDFACGFIILCAVEKGQGSVYFPIIQLSMLLTSSFLLPALTLCLFSVQTSLLNPFCLFIHGEHHIPQTLFQNAGAAISERPCSIIDRYTQTAIVNGVVLPNLRLAGPGMFFPFLFVLQQFQIFFFCWNMQNLIG